MPAGARSQNWVLIVSIGARQLVCDYFVVVSMAEVTGCTISILLELLAVAAIGEELTLQGKG